MNDDERISRLKEILPQLNQQEKICVIAEVAFMLQGVGGDPSSDTEREVLNICDEFEDDTYTISAIQFLADTLVK